MTYAIQIPDNPADKGVTTLEATDVNGKARTLKWILEEDGRGAWYALNLITGKPSKTGHSWRTVLEAYKGVREPVDPTADVAAELADALETYDGVRVDQEAGLADFAQAGENLAADVREILSRLRK